MHIQELKTNVHHLVDEIENEKVLEQFYTVLKSFNQEKQTTDFWDGFTDEQRHDLELALQESEREEHLIPHLQVMEEAKQWLTK